MTKNESTVNSQPLPPQHTMKQTAQVKMKNEGGGGKVG